MQVDEKPDSEILNQPKNRFCRLEGVLLGTAMGDALGLPYENLSRKRAPRLLGPPDRYRFFFRTGTISDDTEHTCFVAQALIACGGQPEGFQKRLATHFRWWLLSLPAGTGKATARAILKLWIGFPPGKSGVYSAGNGPAMRSAILGVAIDDLDTLKEFVRLNTTITHTDPRAEQGALLIALAAWLVVHQETWTSDDYRELIFRELPENATEMRNIMQTVLESVADGQTTTEFFEGQGWKNGATGYVLHSVPAAIHAWLSHPHDFKAGVQAAINCGGDTDTVAAMTGGIIGAQLGFISSNDEQLMETVPVEWLNKLNTWPRNRKWLTRLSRQLAEVLETGTPQKPPRVPAVRVVMRNLIFLVIVLFHGFRRLFPPY